MKLGLSDEDQTQGKHAFSSLWDVCGNLWNNIFDNTHEEKIKDLEEQVRTLKEERNVHDE